MENKPFSVNLDKLIKEQKFNQLYMPQFEQQIKDEVMFFLDRCNDGRSVNDSIDYLLNVIATKHASNLFYVEREKIRFINSEQFEIICNKKEAEISEKLFNDNLEMINQESLRKGINPYAESTNKIEVIGDNKDLNELVMNKILKGK